MTVQFVDDVLDFTGSTMQLGKPALNDLKSGLATAPVLYAAEEHPELHALILRRFKCEGAALSPPLPLTGGFLSHARHTAGRCIAASDCPASCCQLLLSCLCLATAPMMCAAAPPKERVAFVSVCLPVQRSDPVLGACRRCRKSHRAGIQQQRHSAGTRPGCPAC